VDVWPVFDAGVVRRVWVPLLAAVYVLAALVPLATPPTAEAAIAVQPLGSFAIVGAIGTLTTDAAVPVGASIVVLASATGTTGTAAACSDPVNGGYAVHMTAGAAAQGAALAVCTKQQVSQTPTGTTISVTWPGATASTRQQAVALAVTGLTPNSLDRTVGTGPSVVSGTNLSTGTTSTTTSPNEVLIGGFYISRPPGTAGFTAGSNATSNACANTGSPTYTALAAVGTNFSLWVEYCVVSATGAYAAQGTISPGTGYVAALVTYADVPAAPTAVPSLTTATPASATPTPPAPGQTTAGSTPQPTVSPPAGGPPPGGYGPPKPTPTPVRCDVTPTPETDAPEGYVSNPSGSEGKTHSDYDPALQTFAGRDKFRKGLGARADSAWLNDWIARGCSAAWLQDHPVNPHPPAASTPRPVDATSTPQAAQTPAGSPTASRPETPSPFS
jgi:hypothetical protein